MSAWKGESLHAQVQSGCLKTGGQKRESGCFKTGGQKKGKYQRQSWNKTVTCEGFHGYDKSQHQFWEKGPDEKVTPGEVSVPVSIKRLEQFLLLPYRKT